ncbi:SNF2 family domain-containing protein [Colletotrichum orchidophilum]|uniref:SNF2 family domain-containing protein n=1 Tax=Colletotrichum orchidophilum TaxID=1209926 RepID=A0A1G4AR22_9PEZI|nr:SNF2 family domain-containing protein [Colletotrichum orchidophilum]OHE91551.1 SNF2 family domain-containing protein [Colletotrichum orchidophilum]
MDDIPTGPDDHNIMSLAGSPSDALSGLDTADFDPAPSHETDPHADETEAKETVANKSENFLNDSTIDADTPDVEGGSISIEVAIEDEIPELATEETTETFPRIDIGADEHIASIETDDTRENEATITNDRVVVSSSIGPEDDEADVISGVFSTLRPLNFEIILPHISHEDRVKYLSIKSDVVDKIIEKVPNSEGDLRYIIEFTDGRQETLKIPFDELLGYERGQLALQKYQGIMDPENGANDRLWQDEWEESIADSDADLDLMELDEDDAPRQSKRLRSSAHRKTLEGSDSDDDAASRRPKRQRTSTRQSTRHNSKAISDDEALDETPPRGRQLRERTERQLKLTSMAFTSMPLTRDEDLDELSQDHPRHPSDNDDDFQIITSDVLPKSYSSRRSKKSWRLRAKAKITEQPRSRGSSIEFEDRRRSGRSTRNKGSMLDVALMDDDSFYVEDTAPAGAPKVMNIKEVFKHIDQHAPFTQYHSDICSTCNTGTSANKGPLIGCQGCSITFHKSCIGYRSARDHIVTKVGVDDFVLQCKFCIGIYAKKDKNSPRHSRCQQCKRFGRSCAAFSQKKTPRQEEKIRLENGGEDPIAPVEPSLVNNADNILFRCTMCKRGWHYEHLPSSQMDSDVSEIRQQRLAEYSVDWKCVDCGTVSDKIQTLVAWRPLEKASLGSGKTYSDLNEDEKEYLIKWQDKSYFHCSWMPGAWVFHIAAGTMRNSFAKKDADQNLALKFNEAEAIPQDALMADVIFEAKVKAGRAKTLEDEMERIGSVDKIFVKFQGLGYDEAVWDSPPKPDAGEVYTAFKAAYYEYLTGKYFNGSTNARMKERVNKWKDKDFVKLTQQPPGLRRGKLMEYQIEGVNWMLWNYHGDKNAILADEMGLGKTVQVVGLISTLVHGEPKCWPFLIVVPNSTCPNWRREIKQWAPDLRVVTYHGGKQAQELAYKYELFPRGSQDIKAHVVVMSYDSAQDDRTKHLFRSVQWAGLVVDEGQRLKNDKSLLYTALRSMRFPFRLLLTGTPLQNNKRELFNLLQFIDPTQNAAKLDEEFQELNGQNLPELHGRIKQYFLRRTKAQVLKFLPPMAQIIVPVSMSILQEKLCKSIIAKSPDLIKAIFADDKINKRDRGSLSNILMQLRKCLCHPFMYNEAVEERTVDQIKLHENLISASGKLMLLNIMLPKLKERGHRVLIFSQFLNQLDIIEDFLNGLGFQYRRLDGSLSSREKQKYIDDYNEPDSPVFAFLLSTRAGGVGINLATADTVIILDPDFNPHQDIQAISRAHRIGQKHKVLCFQLMTKNSAEEKIMQIGRKKMALDHVLIEAMDDPGESEDLESILKFGASALFSDDQNEKDIVHYDDASVDKLLDRSTIEQTKTGDDNSAESQFSFARVWANDKNGFEDNLAEENEPTVNANVWEEILAEREAEAKRIAELNKEVLGRGGRRRQAINYKTNAIGVVTDLLIDNSDSSDNDGEFVGENDEEEPDTDTENRDDSSKEETTTQDSHDRRRTSQKAQNNNSTQAKTGTSKTKTQSVAEANTGQGALHEWKLNPSWSSQNHKTPDHESIQQIGRPNHVNPLYPPSQPIINPIYHQPGAQFYQHAPPAPESRPGRPLMYDMAWLDNLRIVRTGYGGEVPSNQQARPGFQQQQQSAPPIRQAAYANPTVPAVPEKARRPSFGLSQLHPNASTCAKCGLRHYTGQCPNLASEVQLRLALDHLRHWPSNSRNPAAERKLIEKLHLVATTNDRRKK